MTTAGLLVRFEAKLGREQEVARFLRGALSLAQAEPATTVWFGTQMWPSTFGIFDALPSELGRQAHLAGNITAVLAAKTPDLLAHLPNIEKVDVLTSKLPG